MLLLRFWTCWCYKVEEIEARSMMEMFFHRKEKATVSYGKKNTHDTVAFFYITVSDMLICFTLFQQIVICEVVDAHGVTNIVQCFGGGFSGCGAAFFQDVVYVRKVFLPHFTAQVQTE